MVILSIIHLIIYEIALEVKPLYTYLTAKKHGFMQGAVNTYITLREGEIEWPH